MFFIIFFLFLTQSSSGSVFITSNLSNTGNNYYNSLDDALDQNIFQENDFFIVSDNFQTSFNITKPKIFNEITSISSLNKENVISLQSNLIVNKKLILTNLTLIVLAKNFTSIFSDGSGSTIKIQNCIIKNLEGNYVEFVLILLSYNSTLDIDKTTFLNISNKFLNSIFCVNNFSQIILTDTNFSNIILEKSQILTSNFSLVLMRNITFVNIFSSNFMFESNSLFILKDSLIIIENISMSQSNLTNLHFLKGEISEDFSSFNIENKSSNIILKNIAFIEIFSLSKKCCPFFFLSGESYTSYTNATLENIIFLNCISQTQIFSFNNLRSISSKNVNISNSNAEKNFEIKDCDEFKLIDSQFSNNQGINIFLQNVQNKIFDNISIENCFSNSSTLGIIILEVGGKHKSKSTLINSSYFFNNTMTYQVDSNVGTIFYSNSINEQIFVLNCKFKMNLLIPFNLYSRLSQIGGACMRCSGLKLKLTIVDSLFFENKAVFESNCLQLEANSIYINSSWFSKNVNLIPPIYKSYLTGVGLAGTIFASSLYVIIENSMFDENMNYMGGNIYFVSLSSLLKLDVIINSTKFIDNYSHTFGSCLQFSVDINRMNANVQKCLLYYNWANFNGDIYCHYDSYENILKFLEVYFIKGWSDFSPSAQFDIENGIVSFVNCSFFNNTASWYPRNLSKYPYDETFDYGSNGVMGILSKGSFTIYSQDNFFIDNTARWISGIISMVGGTFIDKNSTFIRNSASMISTFYGHIKSSIFLENTKFIGNFAFRKTSAISIREFSNLTANNTYFKDCKSLGEGLIFLDTQSQGYIYNSAFENIHSYSAIILRISLNNNQKVILENNTYFNCINPDSKELFMFSNSENILLTNNKFYNISSKIFKLIQAGILLTNNSFKDIQCSEPGGIFDSKQNSVLFIQNLIMNNIISSSSGIFLISNTKIEFVEFFIKNIEILQDQSFLMEISDCKVSLTNIELVSVSNGFMNLKHSEANINQLIIKSNYNPKKIRKSSMIKSVYNNLFSIFGSFFFENICLFNGSSLNLNCNKKTQFQSIKNSYFMSNSALQNGGAIYVDNCNIEISSNTFKNNSAIDSGGCIYLRGLYSLSLNNNTFIQNVAKEAGAIKYKLQIPTSYMPNKYIENKAFYGVDIASYPIRIDFENRLNKSFEGRPSFSYPLVENLEFKLVDFYNQTVSTLNGPIVFINLINSTRNNARKGGILPEAVNMKNGVGFIEKLYFYTKNMKDEIKISLTTNSIGDLDVINYTTFTLNESIREGVYSTIINIKILPCIIGEVFDANIMACIRCPKGTYKFDNLDDTCKLCPKNAKECYGANITLLPGYWKSEIYSTNIYVCEPIAESCLGGYFSFCAEGYKGPLCQSCKNDGLIFAKFFSKNCDLCPENKSLIFAGLLIGSLFLLIFYFYMIYSNVKLSDRMKFDEITGIISPSAKEDFFSTIYNKILMNYFQIISLLNFLDLKYDSSLSSYFQIPYYLGNSIAFVYNFDCLISSDFPIQALYLKVVLISIVPIFFLLILASYWYLKSILRKQNYKDRYITCELVFINMLQPVLLSTLTNILICKNIDGKSYISNDYGYECDSKENLNFVYIFVIPSLMIWVVSYPLYNFYRLWRNKKKLNTTEVRRKLGFLYNNFKVKFYYGELIEIYKKYVLIFIINFLQTKIEVKCLLIFLEFFFSLVFLIKKNPYLTSDTNKLVLFADLTCLFTVFISLVSLQINNNMFSSLSAILIILVNTLFVLMVYFRILYISQKKLTQFILRVAPWLKPYLTTRILNSLFELTKKRSLKSKKQVEIYNNSERSESNRKIQNNAGLRKTIFNSFFFDEK